MFVLWFALKNTLFFCELVGVHAPRYADYSIVSVPCKIPTEDPHVIAVSRGVRDRTLKRGIPQKNLLNA